MQHMKIQNEYSLSLSYCVCFCLSAHVHVFMSVCLNCTEDALSVIAKCVPADKTKMYIGLRKFLERVKYLKSKLN